MSKGSKIVLGCTFGSWAMTVGTVGWFGMFDLDGLLLVGVGSVAGFLAGVVIATSEDL